MARAETPQISWHGREPVLGVDVSCTGLVASAGNDNEVRLWKVKVQPDENSQILFQQELNGHSKPVNAVRFSPNGETLASASDDTSIILWKDKGVRSSTFGTTISHSDCTWGPVCVLRGHCADIYDLSWSPDGQGLISGGVDGSCIVWNVSKGRVQQTIRDHEHYVQGVAWDPRGELVVSVSCDRSARIYSNHSRKGGPRDFTCTSAISKTRYTGLDPADILEMANIGENVGDVPSTDLKIRAPRATDHPANSTEKTVPCLSHEMPRAKDRDVRLFLDDAVPSFFRRPAWSPDGSFLLLPCGQHVDNANGQLTPATLVFARADLSTPCAFLPGPTKAVVAVRCCPMLFELRPPCTTSTGEPSNGTRHDAPLANTTPAHSWLPLSYRIIWAVATLDSIILYDSQHSTPLLLASSLHYAALTDLAWLPDARGLVVSSADGYCTILKLDEEQLGSPLAPETLPQCMKSVTQAQVQHSISGDLIGNDPSHDKVNGGSKLAKEAISVTTAEQFGTRESDTLMSDGTKAAGACTPTSSIPNGSPTRMGAKTASELDTLVDPRSLAPSHIVAAGMTHPDGLQVKKRPKRATLIPINP